jgi:large subunit ribosomal protein L14
MKAVPANVTRGLPKGARLDCVDNTGAKIVEIIDVPKLHTVHRRYPTAGVADVIIVAVKKGTPEMRKTVVRAVIIRQRRPYRRPDGTMVAFEDNAAIIVTETGEVKGSDIKGPVAREAAERWAMIAAKAAMIV